MAQYFRIATKDFCNTLKPGSFTGDTMMCPTRSQIESAGLHIKKGYTYAADQLVPEDHIERLDWEYTFSVTPTTVTVMRATVSMWRGHRQTWLIPLVTIKR